MNILNGNHHHELNTLVEINIGLGLWCFMPLSTIFQLYPGDSFLDGGNRSKPSTCHKSLTNFFLSHNVVSITPLMTKI